MGYSTYDFVKIRFPCLTKKLLKNQTFFLIFSNFRFSTSSTRHHLNFPQKFMINKNVVRSFKVFEQIFPSVFLLSLIISIIFFKLQSSQQMSNVCPLKCPLTTTNSREISVVDLLTIFSFKLHHKVKFELNDPFHETQFAKQTWLSPLLWRLTQFHPRNNPPIKNRRYLQQPSSSHGWSVSR